LKASKLFDVNNYCAVVTGGGTGIGLMITQTLVANEARVYITGRRKEALDIVVDKYSTGPGKIIAYVIWESPNHFITNGTFSMPGDISKKEDIQRLVKTVGDSEDGIHLLVNNAGIARDDNTKYSNGKPDFKVRTK
jgi:NAD(P)-dependent dehydrogenase (short-subunit alcohol dehydrogenase family)